jgi:hypothetical protein
MGTQLITPTQQQRPSSKQVLPRNQVAHETRAAGSASLAIPIVAARRNDLFSEALLEMSSTHPPGRATDLFMSLFMGRRHDSDSLLHHFFLGSRNALGG